MQNKANFKKSQMNVTNGVKKNYKKSTLGAVRKTKPNKANSKPILSRHSLWRRRIKANLKNAKNERK
jgi:hypothetical protein